MFRWPVLAVALAMSSPALWSAFAAGSMSATDALIRFLIAIPIAAAMLALLRMVVSGYHRRADHHDRADAHRAE